MAQVWQTALSDVVVPLQALERYSPDRHDLVWHSRQYTVLDCVVPASVYVQAYVFVLTCVFIYRRKYIFK